ncbi:hypothetical protein FRC08_005268 [Ceratobasidium sp. 394]|nr:hypothetical protein FRC08_005268 [Ceratobasidium sp. 394]
MQASPNPPDPNQNVSPISSPNGLTTSTLSKINPSFKSRIVALSSVMRRSTNTLGLPGLSEIATKIEDVAKLLCDKPSTELSLLAERVQLILHTLRSGPSSHQEETKEAMRGLEEILRRVNSALSGKRLASPRRFEEYDELSRQTTSQMEALNLQHMQRSLNFIENIEAWQADIDRQMQLLNELLGDYTPPAEAYSNVNDDLEDKV